MGNKTRALLTFVIAASLAVAVFLGYQRSIYEERNKNVEIAVNLNDLENLAVLSGRSLPQEINLFKVPGMTTIIYKEETITDLKNFISVYSGQDFLLQKKNLLEQKVIEEMAKRNDLNPNYTYVIVQDESIFKRMMKHIGAKMPQAYLNSYDIFSNEHPMWLIVTGLSTGALADLGFGFNPDIIAYLEKNDIQVLPQIRTWNNVKPEGLNAIFSELKGHKNVRTILFNDKVLPGFPDKGLLSVLAQNFKQNDWNVGLIEFMPQKGFEDVAYANGKKVVRFFSIDTKEGDKITPEDALDKYVLAASERNDKLIFVRPLSFMDVDQEQGYISHIDAVKSGLIAKGLTVAPVKEDVSFPVGKYPIEAFILIMSLGVISGGIMLSERLGLLKIGLVCAVLVFFAVVYLTLHTADNILDKIALAEKGMALLAAMIFPTYGLIVTITPEKRNLMQSIAAFLKATLISLAGAAFVVGFLADLAYMVKIDQFMGVKLAHLVPIALVMWYLYQNEKDGKSLYERTLDILKQPLTFGYAMLSVLILAALAIYIIRTGNEATALVSSTELKFRALLDNLLYVRPRTKEFMIAHPLLLMLFYLGYRLRYLPFVALAVMGQASVVDTYAHIHTPVLISLLRTFNGVWVGIVLGLMIIGVYVFYQKKWGSE